MSKLLGNIIQLKDKARYLLNEFKKVRDANNSTGEKRRDFAYYDDMFDIVGDRECIAPTDIMESNDRNVRASVPTSTITRQDTDGGSSLTMPVQQDDDEYYRGNNEIALMPDMPDMPEMPEMPETPTGSARKNKRVTKQSVLSDLAANMQQHLDKQSQFFEEQRKQDTLLMQQFIDINTSAEKTQQAILKALTELVNK